MLGFKPKKCSRTISGTVTLTLILLLTLTLKAHRLSNNLPTSNPNPNPNPNTEGALDVKEPVTPFVYSGNPGGGWYGAETADEQEDGAGNDATPADASTLACDVDVWTGPFTPAEFQKR